jgi:hypothetical protein
MLADPEVCNLLLFAWKRKIGMTMDQLCSKDRELKHFCDGDRFLDFLPLFKQDCRNQLFSLFYDGFPLCTTSSKSSGALYLIPTCIPVEARVHDELRILVGLVPLEAGLKPLTLNTYLRYLVDDITESVTQGHEFYWGLENETLGLKKGYFTLRTAISNLEGDTPAFEDMCGFCGNSSRQGCRFCSKQGVYETTSKGRGGHVYWFGFVEEELLPDPHQLSNTRKRKAPAPKKLSEPISKFLGEPWSLPVTLQALESTQQDIDERVTTREEGRDINVKFKSILWELDKV